MVNLSPVPAPATIHREGRLSAHGMGRQAPGSSHLGELGSHMVKRNGVRYQAPAADQLTYTDPPPRNV